MIRALAWLKRARVRIGHHRLGGSLLAAVAACLAAGGCAETGGLSSAMLAGYGTAGEAAAAAPADPEQAVAHWSKAYAANPRDLDTALAYAQSLKATGKKTRALAVLEQASLIHRDDRRLMSEYGRLALELDQVSVAKPLLEAADDPANPDWRVIMARGTVLAKEGQYAQAVPIYERALALKPDHPSIMSNLALAYTMSGEAAKGEELLRRAAASSAATPKVRQNLALVLSLQGKYEEAKQVAAIDLPADKARANVDAVRLMARPDTAPRGTGGEPDARSVAVAAAAPAAVAQAWETEVVEAPEPPRPPVKKDAAKRAAKSRTALVEANVLGRIVNAAAPDTDKPSLPPIPPRDAFLPREPEAALAPSGPVSFEPMAIGTLGCLRQGERC